MFAQQQNMHEAVLAAEKALLERKLEWAIDLLHKVATQFRDSPPDKDWNDEYMSLAWHFLSEEAQQEVDNMRDDR